MQGLRRQISLLVLLLHASGPGCGMQDSDPHTINAADVAYLAQKLGSYMGEGDEGGLGGGTKGTGGGKLQCTCIAQQARAGRWQ